jgi:hypothetical protein
MKKPSHPLLLGIFACKTRSRKISIPLNFTAFVKLGIGQLPHSEYEGIHGSVQNYKWEDIEPSNNVWKWKSLDSEIMNTEVDLPIMLMIFTKEGKS